MKKVVFQAFVALAVVSPCAYAQEVTIGQVAPMSGVLADTGKEMVLGAKVYFDHINAKGGINGKQIKHIVEGLRKAGPNPTRDKVIKALETLKKHDVGGFTVSFARDNRIGSRFVDITIIGRNGILQR